MKKTLLFTLLFITTAFGKTLQVENGVVKAHTEVFGDSTIDPETHFLVSNLTIADDVTSIRGSIDASILKLKSDNEDRDEHMVKALESLKYPMARYEIKEILKKSRGYTINGVMEFHGVKRPLSFDSDILRHGNKVEIMAKSAIRLSDYKVKPIKLLFLTVRDRVDLNIHVVLKER